MQSQSRETVALIKLPNVQIANLFWEILLYYKSLFPPPPQGSLVKSFERWGGGGLDVSALQGPVHKECGSEPVFLDLSNQKFNMGNPQLIGNPDFRIKLLNKYLYRYELCFIFLVLYKNK